MLQTQNGNAHSALVQGLHIGPAGNGARGPKTMIGQNTAQPLRRAFGPGGEHDARARRLQRLHMVRRRFKDIDAALRAFGREIAPRLAAGIERFFAFRRMERRKLAQGMFGKPFVPFRTGKIEPVRRQRLIRRPLDRVPTIIRAAPHLFAGFVIVGDQGQAGVFRLHRLMRQKHQRTRRVIEQRVEVGIEQR